MRIQMMEEGNFIYCTLLQQTVGTWRPEAHMIKYISLSKQKMLILCVCYINIVTTVGLFNWTQACLNAFRN